MKPFRILLIVVVILAVVFSCEHDPVETHTCSNLSFTFKDDIAPLLTLECNNPGCHNYESTYGDFTTYEGVKAFASKGAIEEQIESGEMPLGGALTDEQKQMLLCWVENGYPNDGIGDTTNTEDTTSNDTTVVDTSHQNDTSIVDTSITDTTVQLSLCDTLIPTYDGHIKRIFDQNCMGSSCHKSGASIGDLSAYGAIPSHFKGASGEIYKEVVQKKTMPTGGKTLSQAQRDTIECWLENGALEN